MQLPRPVQGGGASSGGGARYNVLVRAQVVAGQTLQAVVNARSVPWLARRIVIQGPPGSICRLFSGTPGMNTLVDGTDSGELDIADYYQPLYIENGIDLIALWTTPQGTGFVAGSEAVIRIELEEAG